MPPPERGPLPIGYGELLRTNPRYRRLWLANIISLLGDWLDLIAIADLVLVLAAEPGSTMTPAAALAVTTIARFLPNFLFGPLAGNVADRYPRHRVMALANFASSACVLGFLFVLKPEGLWFLTGLLFLKMAAQSFFIPANQASVPMLVPREHLMVANTIQTTSWSLMLAVGAIAGAAVVEFAGARAALIFDILTFLVANCFLWGLNLPPAETEASRRGVIHDFLEGLKYIRQNPTIIPILTVKPLLGASGGTLLYPLMAQQTWPRMDPKTGEPAIGLVTGLLFAAFGVGTLIGPYLLRRLGFASPAIQQRRLWWGFAGTGVFWILFSLAGPFALAFGWLVASSAGRALLWVYSTTLLQVMVPDRFRGRVFAAEFGLMTLMMTIATWLSQLAIDHHLVGPRELGVALGVIPLVATVPFLATNLRNAWVTLEVDD